MAEPRQEAIDRGAAPPATGGAGAPDLPPAGAAASGRGLGMRAKLVLLAVLPLAVLLAAVTGLILHQFEVGMQSAVEAELRDRVNAAAGRIESENAATVATVRAMAGAQEAGMFGRRAESMRFTRDLIEKLPGTYAVYFAYDVDADGHDRDAANRDLPAGALGDGGRFLPYWYRDEKAGGAVSLKPLSGMADSLWFRGVANRLAGQPDMAGIVLEGGVSRLWNPDEGRSDPPVRAMITEPYSYEGQLIVETTWPIVVDGRFRGVAGIDRSLSRIADHLREMLAYRTARFELVSRRGRVIASTDHPENETQRIEDTPMADDLVAHFRDADGEFSGVASDAAGTEAYSAGALVPTGHWRLLMRVDEAEILEPVVEARRRALWLAIPGILLALGLALAAVTAIARRVGDAVGAARRVADGDLSVEISSHSTDETGDLVRAVQRMVGSLRQLVGRMQQACVDLVSTATGVAAAAKTQESTVADVGASTSQIAAAVREISATAQELLGTINEVAVASGQTALLADGGRSGLDELQGSMSRLAEATGGVSAKLATISERAASIGGVVTTITKVADQTNLLSLNAAIEAEKAGEAGRGFAVVAREIRRLADQTAVASLDIERIVREMQGSVASGVMEMDRFADEVRRRVAEAGTAGERFAEILAAVEGLSPRFVAVQEGMQAQAAGAHQIDEAMVQLTSVAHRSADAVRDLGDAATRLRGAVAGLESEVARFRAR